MPDNETTIHMPIGGLSIDAAFDRQPIIQTRTGTFAYSTPVGVNVRGYDAGQDRSRGGSRPGIVKYLPERPGNVKWVTQLLAVIIIQSAEAQV